jgi:endonuclease-3
VKEFDIRRAWPVLKRQIRALRVPWLDELSARERDPFKILLSCILSLRTQDRTTEKASARLFMLASSPEAIARLSEKAIERAIYPVGFYRVKAKRIKNLGMIVSEKYGGKVPDSIEELLKLEGVGRKTANLVITLGYNKYGICVDTHVHRITNRWGYVKTKTPVETEFALREKLPRRYWKEINGLLVALGQNICKPISPICSACHLDPFCQKVKVVSQR